MFTADGIFIVSIIVIAYVGLKWHFSVKLKAIIRDGGFTHKGKQYDVYYIGCCDKPSEGLPEALRDPDNGAFAPETLPKVKWLTESEKCAISTLNDTNGKASGKSSKHTKTNGYTFHI